MKDISPYAVPPTEQESDILRLVLRHEATPEAIREFTRQRTKLRDYIYWFTLGTLWVSYTGWSDLDLWKRLFASPRPRRTACLMKPSELRALEALPPSFVVYRAHRPGETDWIAYTLSYEIAAGRFARQRGVDQIARYAVQKSDILALFLRRGEDEILVLDRTKPRLEAWMPVNADDTK